TSSSKIQREKPESKIPYSYQNIPMSMFKRSRCNPIDSMLYFNTRSSQIQRAKVESKCPVPIKVYPCSYPKTSCHKPSRLENPCVGELDKVYDSS
ncbi:hypothetical protein CEXT_472091, partial [Caerostris extrusa]